MEKLPGEVNLENPNYQMVYLEDCQTYEDEEINESPRRKRLLFGRLVGSGKNIAHLYDLKRRPYVFSSSMDPVCAHVAAVAALPSVPFHAESQGTRKGIVLDPFCGTASSLVAAAHLGMKVVGTDINFGSGMNAPRLSTALSERQRNSSFRLRQSGIYDNFEKYQLTKQIGGFFANDALNWLIADHKDIAQRGFEKVQFDVIISDPPFGRREHFYSSQLDQASHRDDADTTPLPQIMYIWQRIRQQLLSSDELARSKPILPRYSTDPVQMALFEKQFERQHPYEPIAFLMLLAKQRLKDHVGNDNASVHEMRKTGRLIFWLPTISSAAESEVIDYLQHLMQLINQTALQQEAQTTSVCAITCDAIVADNENWLGLRLLRSQQEVLSTGLSRWLCVFEKT